MKRLWMYLLVVGLLSTAASPLYALDLWPFNDESEPPARRTSGYSRGRPQPKEPSVMEKFSSSTKKLWHTSTDWMTPDPKPSRRGKPQTSLFGSWFRSEPEKRGPQTVTEWMAQPRLDP